MISVLETPLIREISRHGLSYQLLINPHKPVAQKVADEMVFRRFQGEGVEFF